MSAALPQADGAAPEPELRIRSALHELTTLPPAPLPCWTLRIVCALFALLVVWAVLAPLDIVAVAPGRLVPETAVKIVQPAAAGIVREILVREGDRVAAGQVLARLDPTESLADREAIERELAMQRLQLRRIDAELRNEAMHAAAGDDATLFAQALEQQRAHGAAHRDALQQQQAARERSERELAAARELLRKLELTEPSHRRSVAAYEALEARNLVGTIQAEQVRREAIANRQDLAAQRAAVAGHEAAVREAERKLVQQESAWRSDLRVERAQLASRLNQLEQQRVKALFQQANLELRAPQAGLVKELATTSVGAVVQPGTVLASLVPGHEPLLAEVLVDNRDIAVVQPGRRVRIKLAAFPFQRYGMLDGSVRTVIADAQDPARSAAPGDARRSPEGGMESTLAFKASIVLDRQSLLVAGRPLPLVAGMQLRAEIIQGRRTVLQYLLSPLRRMASEAGMER